MTPDLLQQMEYDLAHRKALQRQLIAKVEELQAEIESIPISERHVPQCERLVDLYAEAAAAFARYVLKGMTEHGATPSAKDNALADLVVGLARQSQGEWAIEN